MIERGIPRTEVSFVDKVCQPTKKREAASVE